MKKKCSNPPWILGLSFSHNGAACLLKGDEIVVAIQEERLTRRKRDRLYANEPSLAIPYCLDVAGITAGDLDCVVINSQTRLKNRKNDIYLNPDLRVGYHNTPVLSMPHHLAHAYSAFATSGFDTADILVIDGFGSHYEDLLSAEQKLVDRVDNTWEHCSFYRGNDTEIVPSRKFASPVTQIQSTGKKWVPSLGKIFELISEVSFQDPASAGKVMGLAAFGTPRIPVELFLNVEHGHLEIFDQFVQHFPSSHWSQTGMDAEKHTDLAASAQRALEHAVLELLKHYRRTSDSTKLCYAGGVALNSILNERIIRESGYEQVYIMPASEDNGVAIGAAYYGLFQLTGQNTRKKLIHEGLGRTYSEAEIEKAINEKSSVFDVTDEGIEQIADRISSGQIGAWFHGRSEFGPRALGNRSILCDPRNPNAKDFINKEIKRREPFRPFAPSVLIEHVEDWFESGGRDSVSPFMLRVMEIKPEKANQVPAVLHVDDTARVQTVAPENGPYYDLIQWFYKKTGIPMLLNTSLNIMGEPIVEQPEDALWSLLETPLAFCAFPGRVVSRKSNSSFLDLLPVVNSFSYTLQHGSSSNGYKKPDLDDLVVTYPATRWGVRARTLKHYYFSLLRYIDGETTNYGILLKLNMNPENKDHVQWWLKNVRILVRSGLIDLQYAK
ncbi:MAG: hypothetical protein MI864_02005 [Pseudomonadales bacterium]|nr:hypothetical protein [Pseudomonadales bacterium]